MHHILNLVRLPRLPSPIRFVLSALQVVTATLALGAACLVIGFSSL
jgi:hypothetical protein